MYSCDICEESDCLLCTFGNPCLGCKDYDEISDLCTSNGGCGSAHDKDTSES